MFEKEAKKWVKENSRIEHSASFGEIAVEPSAEKGFQKGAEFGYNKANEWHYVKDELPKESGRYLVYVGGGENGIYPLDFDTEANDFGYWCLDVGENLGVRDSIFETVAERNEDAVIAWKEIVLPKE